MTESIDVRAYGIETRSGVDLDRLAGLFGVKRAQDAGMVETDESLRERTFAEFKRLQGAVAATTGTVEHSKEEAWRCGCWRRTSGDSVQTFRCSNEPEHCVGLGPYGDGLARALVGKTDAPIVITSPEQAKELFGETGIGLAAQGAFDSRGRAGPVVTANVVVKTDDAHRALYLAAAKVREHMQAYIAAAVIPPRMEVEIGCSVPFSEPTLSEFNLAVRDHLLPKLPARLTVVTDSVAELPDGNAGFVLWVFDENGSWLIDPEEYTTVPHAGHWDDLAAGVASALMRREARGQ